MRTPGATCRCAEGVGDSGRWRGRLGAKRDIGGGDRDVQVLRGRESRGERLLRFLRRALRRGAARSPEGLSRPDQVGSRRRGGSRRRWRRVPRSFVGGAGPGCAELHRWLAQPPGRRRTGSDRARPGEGPRGRWCVDGSCARVCLWLPRGRSRRVVPAHGDGLGRGPWLPAGPKLWTVGWGEGEGPAELGDREAEADRCCPARPDAVEGAGQTEALTGRRPRPGRVGGCEAEAGRRGGQREGACWPARR